MIAYRGDPIVQFKGSRAIDQAPIPRMSDTDVTTFIMTDQAKLGSVFSMVFPLPPLCAY